jgi:hypothetical protein
MAIITTTAETVRPAVAGPMTNSRERTGRMGCVM